MELHCSLSTCLNSVARDSIGCQYVTLHQFAWLLPSKFRIQLCVITYLCVSLSVLLQVSDKVWRVVTSYLEMKEHSKCIVNQSKLPGSKIEPRSKAFEEKEHKSLCADLKYLYTAVTRAKCNLWIYDSDKTKRLPMFDYWHKRGLVKVVSTTKGGESKHDVIFASISTLSNGKYRVTILGENIFGSKLSTVMRNLDQKMLTLQDRQMPTY